MGTKYVYFFGSGKAGGEGNSSDVLGGKGANLAEMARMGVPAPPRVHYSYRCLQYLPWQSKLSRGTRSRGRGESG